MQLDLKYCTIKIKDGGSNFITVKIGEGNITWTEKVDRQYYLDRGRLADVRNGDEQPVELKTDFTWETLTASSGGTPTVEDVLKNRGEAEAWVSSDTDTCQPFAVDIEITYDPPCAEIEREIYLFSDFRYEQLDHDMKAGTVSMNGKANITMPIVTRSAQT